MLSKVMLGTKKDKAHVTFLFPETLLRENIWLYQKV